MNHIFQRIEKILLFAALFALLGLAAAKISSFDIFWQLQSGRHIVETKTFIYKDIFSLAAEASRFEHCWLHDVIFYGIHALLGYQGMSLLKGLLIAATAATLVGAARIRNSSRLAILLILFPVLAQSQTFWSGRPQLWSFLLFALFVLILENHRRDGGRKVYLLVPLMALWANLHAGSVLAFPILAAYVVGEGVDLLLKRSDMDRVAYLRLWKTAILLVIASLATPYGLMTLHTLQSAPSLGSASGAVTQVYNWDWRAITFERFPQFFYIMGGTFALMLAGWRRLSFSDLFLLGGLAYMGLHLERHTPFFLFAVVALVPRYVEASADPLIRFCRPGAVAALRAVALVAALWGAVYFGGQLQRMRGFFDLGLATGRYPVAAAEFVKEEALPANLFHDYMSGGYLMWSLYPDYLVFWDGRQDSNEMFRWGLDAVAGRDWQRIFERFDVKTVVTLACSVVDGGRYPLIDQLRASPFWSPVFADDSSLVFVRNDAVDSRWLAERRLPDSRVDDTILSTALLISRQPPLRPRAYWEMARVYLGRKDYLQAFTALERYLSTTPPDQREPDAENYYRILYPVVGEK